MVDNPSVLESSPEVTWGQNGEFDEFPQVQAGFLDSNTSLVELTVGGNDSNFSDVVQTCIETGCPSNSSEDSAIDAMVPNLENVLTAIYQAAPNAKIVLLGYPDLFDTTQFSSTCETQALLTEFGMEQLNTWGNYMAADQQKAVNEVASNLGVPANQMIYDQADVANDFAGFQICDADSALHAIVLGQTGPGDFDCSPSTLFSNWCISRSSFHPTDLGAQLYSVALEQALGESVVSTIARQPGAGHGASPPQ